MNNLARFARVLRPQGLVDVQRMWQFGQDHQLVIGRLAQARQVRQVSNFALGLLPPMLLSDALIVDVGANVGEFTAAILAVEPRARVMAIEPVTHRQLDARFRGDARVRVDAHAIWDAAGVATINLTENRVFSSVLTPRKMLHDEYANGTAVIGTTEVPTARLDDLVNEPVALLKIDVQGAEAAVLRGAEKTLSRTRAVLLEVLFVSHYDGDVTFPDLHRLMEGLGWRLRGMTQPHGNDDALWADACYVPAAPPR